MEKPRPYVTSAVLCDRVLEEGNGSISLIRIADRLGYLLGQGIPAGFRPQFQISGLVGIKSGPVTGEHVLKVVVENPAGSRKEVFSFNLKLEGKDHGQNIILNLTIQAELDGLHWFDVIFDDEVLTRIPLTIAPEEPAKPLK